MRLENFPDPLDKRRDIAEGVSLDRDRVQEIDPDFPLSHEESSFGHDLKSPIDGHGDDRGRGFEG